MKKEKGIEENREKVEKKMEKELVYSGWIVWGALGHN